MTICLSVFFVSVMFAADVLPLLPANPLVVDAVDNLKPNEGKLLSNFTCRDMFGGAGLSKFETFATIGPGIRNFCNKWVYANSRERALYCGGNHGAPHRFNDVWEFDLVSNTWTMLHKPDSNASPIHTWWGLTYDQDRDKLYWMCVANPWDTVKPPLFVYDPYEQSGWRTQGINPEQSMDGISGYFPNIKSQGSTFEYIDNQKKMIWYDKEWDGSGMLSYDPSTNKWSPILSQGATYFNCPDCPGQEALINYDSKNNLLVAFRTNKIFHYSFSEKRWSLVDSGSYNFTDFSGCAAYDSDHGIHLVRDGVSSKIYSYNAATKTLTPIVPLGQAMTPNFQLTMCFYHKSKQVFVFYGHGVSNVWVYRLGATTSKEILRPSETYENWNVFPNPFNPSAVITFRYPVGKMENSVSNSSIKIYNLKGALVDRLNYSSCSFSQGCIQMRWKASELPSGLYLIQLKIGRREYLKHIVLTR